MNSLQARITAPTTSRHSPLPLPGVTVIRAPFRLTAAQAQGAFVPLIALTMSGLMSLAMSAYNFGIHPGLPLVWLQNWALGFGVALPTALLVVPMIRNGLARVTVPSSSVHSPSPPHGHEPVTRASIKAADSRLSAVLAQADAHD